MPVGAAGWQPAPPWRGPQILLGETLIFSPTKRLARDDVLRQTVCGGAGTAAANRCRRLRMAVHNGEAAAVVRTDPARWQHGCAYSAMEIYFSAPVDEATLKYVTTSARFRRPMCTPITAITIDAMCMVLVRTVGNIK
jgi:hypothetical protein